MLLHIDPRLLVHRPPDRRASKSRAPIFAPAASRRNQISVHAVCDHFRQSAHVRSNHRNFACHRFSTASPNNLLMVRSSNDSASTKFPTPTSLQKKSAHTHTTTTTQHHRGPRQQQQPPQRPTAAPHNVAAARASAHAAAQPTRRPPPHAPAPPAPATTRKHDDTRPNNSPPHPRATSQNRAPTTTRRSPTHTPPPPPLFYISHQPSAQSYIKGWVFRELHECLLGRPE